MKEYNETGAINLIGFDSTSDEVQLLESGIMTASIVQKPFNMGYLGVKAALKLIDGEKPSLSPISNPMSSRKKICIQRKIRSCYSHL